MKFLLGKKLKMTQMFTDAGEAVPITLIEALPCVVTQVKTKERDGYDAAQVGGEEKKTLNKPRAGHVKGLRNVSYFCEYRPKNADGISGKKRGDEIDVSVFHEGETIEVSALTKGKGFQGVVKRHGFRGGPASHGQKHSLRKPGSIGAGGMQRVILGLRMAGRMGGVRKTMKNVRVVRVDKENNIIALRGAVPGHNGARVELKGKEQ